MAIFSNPGPDIPDNSPHQFLSSRAIGIANRGAFIRGVDNEPYVYIFTAFEDFEGGFRASVYYRNMNTDEDYFLNYDFEHEKQVVLFQRFCESRFKPFGKEYFLSKEWRSVPEIEADLEKWITQMNFRGPGYEKK